MNISERYNIRSEDLIIVENGQKILLANSNNGMWLVIPKINYEIMKEGLKSENLENYLKQFDRDEQSYLKNFYDELIQMNLLYASPENAEYTKYKAVTLAITNMCNLQCIHCCQNAILSEGQIDIKMDKVMERIDKVLKLKPEMISITGGEPMIRKDFSDICFYLRKNYTGKLILMTNGTLIGEKNAEMITEIFDSVDISIDGTDEVSCGMIRGKGVFDRVLKGIAILRQKSNIAISLSMVLTRENEKLKKEFADLNKQLGTNAVLRPLAHSGRANKNDMLFPNEGKYYKVSQDKSNKLSEVRKEKKCRTCLAAKKTIFIDSDGKIYPCGALNSVELCLGNIDKHNIEMIDFENAILQSKGYSNFLQMYPEKQEKCKKCTVSLFCFNCIAQYNAEKDCLYFDDLCKKRKELLEKIVWEGLE